MAGLVSKIDTSSAIIKIPDAIPLEVFQFRSNSRIVICGPSSCGKSRFIEEALKNGPWVFQDFTKYKRVIYCIPPGSFALSSDYTKRLQSYIPFIEFVEGAVF